MTKPLDHTALIVQQLPGVYSEKDHWVIPDGGALRQLADMLGVCSQAFLFLDQTLGDRDDSIHNVLWHRQFTEWMKAAWWPEFPPVIFVETETDFKIHGSDRDGAPTSEALFGSQTGDLDHRKRPTAPTPIRIYGAGSWEWASLSLSSYSLHQAIIEKLVRTRALHLDDSPDHFDARMDVWLERAGAKSDVYEQVVHIEQWKDGSPVIASITELSPLAAQV